MIEINLLPKELRTQKKTVSFPVQRWLTLGLIVLFLLWIALFLESGFIRTQIGGATQDLQGIQATHGDTQKLIDKLDKVYKPSCEYFSTYIRRHISWAPVLNIISDDLPDNIWLTMLKGEDTSKLWALTIRGASRPFKKRPSIRIIGDYVGGLRGEFAMIEKSVPVFTEVSETAKISEPEETTTTKRKVAGNIEITEFLAVFTRRYE